MDLNPFSTRFTDIDVADLVPSPEWLCGSRRQDIRCLAADFRRNGDLGQIVGPHGCGKSRLGRELMRILNPEPMDWQMVILRRDRRAPFPLRTVQPLSTIHGSSNVTRRNIAPEKGRGRLMLLDGGELLSRLHRWLLVVNARRRSTGLILTTHRPLSGIPILAQLRPDPDHFTQIAETLLQRSGTSVITRSEIRAVYRQCEGNYRDGLGLLYDLHARKANRSVDSSAVA